MISCIAATAASASVIVGVSVPGGSQEPPATTPWSAAYPINTGVGIGVILNPTLNIDPFALHSHAYIRDNVPNPAVAIVTYTFDTPTVVDQLELRQHANGITKVEGLVGNSLSAMIPIGDIFSAKGDVTGSLAFSEWESTVFDFNNSTPGTYFQFIVTKTSLANGFANYRAYPSDASGNHYLTTGSPVPEPSTYLAGLSALGMLGLLGGRNRK